MRVREAKDFLVAQTAEQAALEGMPLSDVEKRMMYFTESGYVPEDPIKLSEIRRSMRLGFRGFSTTPIIVCGKRTMQLARTGTRPSDACAAATTICW